MNIDPFIVAIDGLDGSGKSTFSKKLYAALEERFGDQFNIIYQHFPVYENTSGKEILELLQNGITEVTQDVRKEMIRLQQDNRSEWWMDYKAQESNGRPDIIVADRYKESNIIYNILPEDDWERKVKFIRGEESPIYDFNPPNVNVQIYTLCDFELQMKRIENRTQKKDKYETRKHQKMLAKRYLDYLIWLFGENNRFEYSMVYPLHLTDHVYITQRSDGRIPSATTNEALFIENAIDTITVANPRMLSYELDGDICKKSLYGGLMSLVDSEFWRMDESIN